MKPACRYLLRTFGPVFALLAMGFHCVEILRERFPAGLGHVGFETLALAALAAIFSARYLRVQRRLAESTARLDGLARERSLADRALRESEERLQFIFEASPAGIIQLVRRRGC